jgi:hypothetical protein
VADQSDVRRVALSLPGTSEAEDRFAFSVHNKGKQKGLAWVWAERVQPKKPRVPRSDVVAVRVANQHEKEALLAADDAKFSPSRTTTASPRYSSGCQRSTLTSSRS